MTNIFDDDDGHQVKQKQKKNTIGSFGNMKKYYIDVYKQKNIYSNIADDDPQTNLFKQLNFTKFYKK